MIEIKELRALAAERANISGFTGTLADLSKEDRELLIDTMAILVNQSPLEFGDSLREFAVKRIESDFFQSPFKEFGLSEGLQTFGTEFASQAKQVATLQLGSIKTALTIAAIAFGVSLAFKVKK
tara:strand:+ start:5142 stop:5513 length:372 start_codon:yes stop_codon:yes gene_type:complete